MDTKYSFRVCRWIKNIHTSPFQGVVGYHAQMEIPVIRCRPVVMPLMEFPIKSL